MATKRHRSSLEPRWILVFVFFLAGLFGGGLSTYLYTNAKPLSQIKYHPARSGHTLINPTLVTEPNANYNNFSSVSKDLELNINGIIASAKNNGIEDAGVYFRDLEPGIWLAVNANMTFSPGILLKVPIMISYYKLAEQDESLLSQKLRFDGTYLLESNLFTKADPLTPGVSYTVDDLITRMIRNSDETAAKLLFDNINKTNLSEIFSDLGVDFNEDTTSRDFISLKRYGLFFRVLYNSTYLTPDYSEKALEVLSEDKSRSLLQKNLPQSITFVSRVGGRTFMQKNASVYEAYECDIVYYPDHDYLLCVSARGQDLPAVSTLFSNIGSAIYEHMTYQYQ